MVTKKEFQSTWAEYFCKYINEYKINGIEIWGVPVQMNQKLNKFGIVVIFSRGGKRFPVKNFLGSF